MLPQYMSNNVFDFSGPSEGTKQLTLTERCDTCSCNKIGFHQCSVANIALAIVASANSHLATVAWTVVASAMLALALANAVLANSALAHLGLAKLA